MCTYLENIRKIFWCGVRSVQPANLFTTSKCLTRSQLSDNSEILSIGEEHINLTDKRCHLIGFGKAVLGMAVQMERVLDKRLKSGLISIPIGTLKQFSGVTEMQLRTDSVIGVHEGAKNNLPDEKSMQAAIEIHEYAKSMNSNDILVVLISGGGSALLPLPERSITLEQKVNVIRQLSHKGATIDELNIVRIAISQTKGGKLARTAKNAFRIISLIISDIVNDPIHLIASGPTVEFKSDGRTAERVLKKYELWNDLEMNIQDIILTTQNIVNPLTNSSVYVIGSNKIATKACYEEAVALGYVPFILSTSIEGNLELLASIYTKFLVELKKFLNQEISKDEFEKHFPFDSTLLPEYLSLLDNCKSGETLLLILAGEPTAYVKGDGIGGRNQELALRMSIACHENSALKDVCFLSAGTDGIDGPTPAAGAIGCAAVIEDFLSSHSLKDLQHFIDRNDSYTFYSQHSNYHIVTGHTGTNVMDLHLIAVPI